MHLAVDDIDGHHRRTKAAGVEVLNEPHAGPGGMHGYSARDLEGNVWTFAVPFFPLTTSTEVKPGPRDRLLDSARAFTYQQGVNVGVDAILEHANVARRSLYQHFGGKDELIAATLRASAEADEHRYRAALDSGGEDSRKRLLAVFDTLDRTTSSNDFRGCRYTAAELSYPSRSTPPRPRSAYTSSACTTSFAANSSPSGALPPPPAPAST